VIADQPHSTDFLFSQFDSPPVFGTPLALYRDDNWFDAKCRF